MKRLSFKTTTAKVNRAQVLAWCAISVKKILADLDNPECHLHGRQDYFTATDVEACVRLLAAKAAGDDYLKDRFDEPGSWWGYGSGQGVRISVVDNRYRTPLLSLCREYLQTCSKLEGHNFGRGHISGMRYRPRGKGKSEVEKKTIEKRNKPKPVHIKQQGDEPSYQRKALCQIGIVRKQSWRSSHRRNGPITTDDVTKVTCKRCLNILKQQKVEA